MDVLFKFGFNNIIYRFQQDFTCPRCNKGFIEELPTPSPHAPDSENADEMMHEDDGHVMFVSEGLLYIYIQLQSRQYASLIAVPFRSHF